MEAAVDLGFFNDRILITAAYFRNRVNNQLVQSPLSSLTGFTSILANFPALVQNKGWEFTLNSTNVKNENFSWNTSLNFSLPNNKLLSFPTISSSNYRSFLVVGQSLNVIYKAKYLGVDPTTGVYKFQDLNNDGIIDEKDYQTLGNTDPKFTGGLTNNFSYKNWGLNFVFNFAKQTGLNYLASTNPLGMQNLPSIYTQRWQKPGDNSILQKATATFGSDAETGLENQYFSNAYFSNASYLRLKNVKLYYNLSVALLSHLHIQSFQFYVSGQNLVTFSSYIGDPETQNLQTLPPLKTIVAGIQINL